MQHFFIDMILTIIQMTSTAQTINIIQDQGIVPDQGKNVAHSLKTKIVQVLEKHLQPLMINIVY